MVILLKNKFRKMKMLAKGVCFFTWISILTASANVSVPAQKISLTYRDVALKTVLKAIENQSNYSFLYSGEIDTDVKVSINVINMEVDKVLKTLFERIDIGFSVVDNYITIRQLTKAQPSTQPTVKQDVVITGTVTDDTGESMPGVAVTVK